MAEEAKVETIEIDDKKYNLADLSQEQRILIAHVQSLDSKIATARFNLDQLTGGRNYFMTNLKQTLATEEEVKS